ncbi:cystathionine beta-lyase [Acetobacter nitrogenifigens DSM 23921 = NBRC 105050]|uniref:Cystathionine beta-lyase n=1 Tax=Acetobacter nitrogenifigens DSM 23921 = NBRC 105050 TaxID=1120919 RepID=A0A511XBB8_9PROT|nr:cystathionine beta-lyase [Acetobacter nitrogenifigens]GBQ90760.1 cystathionine beta-lyase [Acetobacter nitrogenifigens DSM 23921 = NBRC 105050]GEN60263.1 cystathionine beta-lyase [Acetobacter nitrogenifigens DSM 23921 = NBRC 105050]
MSDENAVSAGWERLNSLLVRVGRPEIDEAPQGGRLVNPSVTRGSTVLFPDIATMQSVGRERYEHVAIYGAMGSTVQHQLERAVAAIEGGANTQVVSSGLAACTTALLVWTSAGGHCLIPDSCYGPTRRFADTMLRRFGVETEYYDPCAGEGALRALMRSNTQVVFAESPGSHTFEIQDVKMLARVAHDGGARLLLDNTWGFGVFSPFEHGVDVSIQALTKYAAGHSDAVLGAITVADDGLWRALRDAAIQLGQLAGPDECWLTLRGLRTMGVRLAHQSRTALQVARWLDARPEVFRVLHPALPDCPGHALWKRDFSGAGTVFGVSLTPAYTRAAMEAMVDSLALFGIGASWGGFESLVLPTTGGIVRSVSAPEQNDEGPSFRLNIGLEAAEDLIADLENGLGTLAAT